MYVWKLPNWPNFEYEPSVAEADRQRYAEKVSFLAGSVHGLADIPKLEHTAYQLAIEGVYSSRIEGVEIKVEDIKKSIANNLRPDLGFRSVYDQRAKNLASIVSDNYQHFATPLTHDQLFDWHRQLVAHRNDLKQVGSYRQGKESMQIVSGPFGKEEVHYVAPPADMVPANMDSYVEWFNNTPAQNIADSVIKAGLAHLYFELIHPFEDGNGRIGRVISEKALAQGLGMPLPFSLSYIIGSDTASYYKSLKENNQSLTIDSWISYFSTVCLEATERGREVLRFTLSKVRYFSRFKDQFDKH